MTNYNLPSCCVLGSAARMRRKKAAIYRHVRCFVFVFPYAQILI
jgi:hypothetical protein